MSTDSWIRALLVAMAVPFLNQAFLALAGMLRLGATPDSMGSAIATARMSTWNLGLAQAASVTVLLLLAWPHRAENGAATLRLQPLFGLSALLCVVAGIGLQFPLAEFGNLVHEVWPISFEELAWRQQILTPETWFEGIGAVVAFVLVAPVTEELVFRGWLMGALEERFSQRVALVASSFAFGLVHVSPDAVVYATLAGLVLGWVVQRSGSLVASIALHAGVNAAPLLLPPYLIRIRGFNTLSDHVEHLSLGALTVGILLAGGALFVFSRIHESEA